jgi:hypothetical protein
MNAMIDRVDCRGRRKARQRHALGRAGWMCERQRAGVRTRTLVRALACTSARSSCTRTNHCSSFLH